MSSHGPRAQSEIHHLVRYAHVQHVPYCPSLDIPPDDSSIIRVRPMPKKLHRFARKVAHPKECFHNAATIVFNFERPSVKYVVGYADVRLPVEHAWIKIGTRYYDPTWELFSTVAPAYLPYFELDRYALCQEMMERDSLYPPVVAELLNRANRGRTDVNMHFWERPPGPSKS